MNNQKSLNKKVHLTQDEVAILQLVADGYSNEAIGKKLFMSYHTVKSHLAKITKHLNAVNRTNAIYKVTKLGIF